MNAFPVDAHTANRCRNAWLDGAKSALNIFFRPMSGRFDIQTLYKLSRGDAGEVSARTNRHVSPMVQGIVTRLAFFDDGRVCNALELVLRQESEETLKWLVDENLERVDEWSASPRGRPDIENPECTDPVKINAFTVFQAFFLGYYYKIFSQVVDTSALTVPTVEGAWAFRSTRLLHHMMTEFKHSLNIRHSALLYLLSLLFLGGERFLNEPKARNSETLAAMYLDPLRLLGVVRKRALLTGSLFDIKNLGRFILFDVCVNGIPTDMNGAVFAATSDQPRSDIMEEDFLAEKHFDCVSNQLDLTTHIEPDWQNEPDKILVCARYQGRRIRTVDVLEADCLNDMFRSPFEVDSMEVLEIHDLRKRFRRWSISDLLTRGIPEAIEGKTWIHVRIPLEHLRSRYFVVYFLGLYDFNVYCFKDGRVAVAPKYPRVAVVGPSDDE